MPEQERVEIVESTLPDHVDPAVVDLLRGCSVEPDRSGKRVGRDRLADREDGSEIGGADEVMTAAVPRGFAVPPGESIEESHDADAWPPTAIAGDERRRKVGDSCLDLETGAAQLVLKVPGRPRLVMGGLRSLPQVARDPHQIGFVSFEPVERR
jgi:hypothetical protein